MVYRKLWEIRESRTGGLRLTAAVTCLALLLFACQGTALADEAAARRAWGGGVPSILSRELASIQSLEDILQTAVANNQSVKIAELGIQEALAGGREVNAALRPQLNLTAQHTRENLANSPAILGEIGAGYQTPDLLLEHRFRVNSTRSSRAPPSGPVATTSSWHQRRRLGVFKTRQKSVQISRFWPENKLYAIP